MDQPILHEMEDAPGSQVCPVCGAELEPTDCPECFGEECFDEYDDDPINFAPGEEFYDCLLCVGSGIVWRCPNAPHEQENKNMRIAH